MSLDREWNHLEFTLHEVPGVHRPLEEELTFYHAVKEGELAYVTENCTRQIFLQPEGMGLLSENLLQNVRYHFVVTAAMITRYCIDGGMEAEKAYCLSDFYIQKMDKCQSRDEISDLHRAMCYDFTGKMQLLHRNSIFSRHIVRCIDYIYSHIHSRITLKDLACYLDLSECYLSKLFLDEVGISIHKYICERKVEKAKNLLKFSDYDLADIANYLSYSSQSHFTHTFEKEVGLSPKKYRDKYYRKSWSSRTEMS